MGLREMIMTMSRLATMVNRKMNRKIIEYFLQMWILCKYQENEFGHIVGRHDELHPVSNTFLGTELPTESTECCL